MKSKTFILNAAAERHWAKIKFKSIKIDAHQNRKPSCLPLGPIYEVHGLYPRAIFTADLRSHRSCNGANLASRPVSQNADNFFTGEGDR